MFGASTKLTSTNLGVDMDTAQHLASNRRAPFIGGHQADDRLLALPFTMSTIISYDSWMEGHVLIVA